MTARSKRLRHIAAVAALSLALAGCNVAVLPSVRSTDAKLPQKVFLTSGLPEGSAPSDLQAGFTRELATALEQRGVTVQATVTPNGLSA